MDTVPNAASLINGCLKGSLFLSAFGAVNGYVVKCFMEYYTEACPRCRGLGVIKCRHCKGTNKVHHQPYTYNSRTAGFQTMPSYSSPCPKCTDRMGNCDCPTLYSDAIWKDTALETAIDQKLNVAWLNMDMARGPFAKGLFRGTEMCPDCQGETHAQLVRPNFERFMRKRVPYHWVAGSQSPLTGSMADAPVTRSNVPTFWGSDRRDMVLNEYNRELGSGNWKDGVKAQERLDRATFMINLEMRAINSLGREEEEDPMAMLSVDGDSGDAAPGEDAPPEDDGASRKEKKENTTTKKKKKKTTGKKKVVDEGFNLKAAGSGETNI